PRAWGRNARLPTPSRFARASAPSKTRRSTRRCARVCAGGSYSSFETMRVGTGRCRSRKSSSPHLRIHPPRASGGGATGVDFRSDIATRIPDRAAPDSWRILGLLDLDALALVGNFRLAFAGADGNLLDPGGAQGRVDGRDARGLELLPVLQEPDELGAGAVGRLGLDRGRRRVGSFDPRQ